MKYLKNKKSGFTLIELLVVISIIGFLLSASILSYTNSRRTAQISAASGDLWQFRSAIILLQDDTGKWPNGCLPNGTTGSSVALDQQQAAINQSPAVGSQGDGCSWTAGDISRWNGPYHNDPTIIDPWSNSFVFDPGYIPYENCAGIPNESITSVVMSCGEDMVCDGGCDDVFLDLK